MYKICFKILLLDKQWRYSFVYANIYLSMQAIHRISGPCTIADGVSNRKLPIYGYIDVISYKERSPEVLAYSHWNILYNFYEMYSENKFSRQ